MENQYLLFEFDSTIWKIHSDGVDDSIVLELRNQESQEVHFAAIQQNVLIWDDLQLEELWWVNSMVLRDNILLVHQYDDSPFPSPAFLMGIDINSKEIAWVLDDMSFETLGVQSFSATPSKPTSLPVEKQWFDIRTGQPIRVNALKKGEENINLVLPSTYTLENKHFKTFQQFLKEKKLPEPHEQVEYLAYKDFIILSTYHKNETGISQSLYIFNGKGERLHSHCLQEKSEGKSSQSFLVHYHKLVMLKEKSGLLVQPL